MDGALQSFALNLSSDILSPSLTHSHIVKTQDGTLTTICLTLAFILSLPRSPKKCLQPRVSH